MSEAPAGSNSSLWALDQLRVQLQRAAAMCQPSAAVRAVAQTEESFDSADMEDVDSDEGVGVDERAAELSPEDFLQEDDEEWYASARWVLNRQETRAFLAESLLGHVAPLYVPFAAIDARTPVEIVPEDVQKDIETFTDDFVLDQNLYSMSVQDVKDGFGAALGASGLTFIPHEMPVYDDCTFEEPGDHVSALGAFGDKFEDTDDGWNTWYTIFQGEASVDEDDADDEEDEEDEDDKAAAAASGAMSGILAGKTDEAGPGSAGGPEEEEEEEDDSDLAAAGAAQTERQAIEKSAAKEAARGRNARALLREVIAAVLSEKVGLRQLPSSSESAMAALEHRLAVGKNARNALMLLKRTTCHPIVLGKPLGLAATSQAAVRMLMAGPLRSIRIETEDLPNAAMREAELFAARFLQGAGGQDAKAAGSCKEVCERLLGAAGKDAALAQGVSGWCLKFLFEGEAMEEAERRREAFVQCAQESVLGPLVGLAVDESDDGATWRWDAARLEDSAALSEFAAAYGESFELLSGASLASVLATFRSSLAAAGFALAPWCPSEQAKAPSTAEAGVDASTSTDTHDAASHSAASPAAVASSAGQGCQEDAGAVEEDLPVLGALPTPPVSSGIATPLPPGFQFQPPPLPPGLDTTPLPVPPGARPTSTEASTPTAASRTEC